MSSYTAYNSNSSNTTSTMISRLKHAIKNSLSTNLPCAPQQYHNYSTAWSTKYIVILPSSSWLQFIVTRTVKYMQIDKCNKVTGSLQRHNAIVQIQCTRLHTPTTIVVLLSYHAKLADNIATLQHITTITTVIIIVPIDILPSPYRTNEIHWHNNNYYTQTISAHRSNSYKLQNYALTR